MMRSDRANAAATLLPARALMLALVVLVVAVGGARMSVEAPFFFPPSLVTSAGVAPVPQDDALTPALDKALRNAATALPAGSVCIITADSWSRDYFRASYLLMPRTVWPVVSLLSGSTPSIAAVNAAISRHRADCLLDHSGGSIPRGWRLLTDGPYASYVPARHS